MAPMNAARLGLLGARGSVASVRTRTGRFWVPERKLRILRDLHPLNSTSSLDLTLAVLHQSSCTCV